MTTARQHVVSHLTPLLPKSWAVVDYLTEFDRLSRPTVMVHAINIEKLPASPQGALLVTFEVTILDPHTDSSRAWGVLDDEVVELIQALDTDPALGFTGAIPTVYSNNFGWNLTIAVPFEKE